MQTAEIYEEDNLNSDNIIGNFYECKTLTDEQKTAVNNVLKAKISVVTGGGGVGKSTIIREIARNLSIRGIGYVVCSFTGKAVSRLHEIMKNKNAITIDRFIMKTKERKVNDAKFDISAIKHIIIDEASMVTTELFYRLLQQLDTNVCITFVGDLNQLPAIGWGSLMKELINCGRIPTFYLTKNQRIQSSSSFLACALVSVDFSLDTPAIFPADSPFLPTSKSIILSFLVSLYSAAVSDKNGITPSDL